MSSLQPLQSQTLTNTAETFEYLLNQRRRHPKRSVEIDACIRQVFAQTHAVWILDSAGFSRQTRDQGIVPALLNIYQMRELAAPLIAASGGTLFKAEADNLYALFPSVDAAVIAAWAVIHRLNRSDISVSIGIGFGEVLVVGDTDVFGHQMNLASKLGEDLAEHNQVLMTEAAFSHLSPQRLDTDFVVTSVSSAIAGLNLNLYQVNLLTH
ncbi:MAG: adenylate/guanylate cyclase domain-containing protein [Cyanobacteria bacterium P01_D01_bin.128]